MIRCVGSPALSTMMDIVPPTIANEPLALYLEPDDMGLDYIHITNTDAKTEFHAAFDEGVLPMKAVFSVLNRVGFDGWCSLELLNPYFKDPELYLGLQQALGIGMAGGPEEGKGLRRLHNLSRVHHIDIVAQLGRCR